MKKCPNCSRTYADDGFTFCLEDGALLSPPYDPSKSEGVVSTIQSGGPPPTAVLPRSEKGGHELPSTVKSSPVPSYSDETNPQTGVKPESSGRRNPIKYVVIGLVTLTIVVSALGLLGLYVSSASDCPKVVIVCNPSEANTYCHLAEDSSAAAGSIHGEPISEALCSRTVILLQAAALPKGVTEVTWSASSGAIRTENQSQMIVIDTSGLAGKTIELKANVTSSSWFCSKTVATSFVVPQGFGPAR